MAKSLSHLVKLCRLFTAAVRHRRIYGSFWEAARAFRLKLAATTPGRRFFSAKLCQLRLRDLPEPIHLRQTTSDIFVVEEIFERAGYQTVRNWRVPDGGTILDLGGNIGLATLYFAQLFPSARFVIVEPDKTNRQLLELNCRSLIAAQRAIVVAAFVGAHDGLAAIDRSGDHWGFRKIEPGQNASEMIESLSIPTLAIRQQIEGFGCVKCDIEGSEAELFADCQTWIGGVQYLFVETHREYTLTQLYAHLRSAGWKFKVVEQSEGPGLAQCFLEKVL